MAGVAGVAGRVVRPVAVGVMGAVLWSVPVMLVIAPVVPGP
ncbi:hypothetical protein [Streptomyces lydicus]|nr:hypothetical protein [Streptomyces lydicus]